MHQFRKMDEARSYFRAGQRLQRLMLACVAVLAIARFSHVYSAAQAGDQPLLVAGVPITRELSGGQLHSYQVTVAQGQCMEAIVQQNGIDVVVRVFAPDGKQISEFDSPNGTQGPELVMLVAEVTGAYRLAVISGEPSAKAGRYEARLVEVRQASQQDRDQIAAVTTFRAARKLSSQKTKESYQAAVKKFEEARQLFQAAGNTSKEASMLNYMGNHLLSLGQMEQAGNSFTRALALFRSVRNQAEEARTLNNLGGLHSLTGEQQKALEYFKESLPLLRTAGDRNTEAATLNNIGHVYQELSENQQAFDYLSQALSLYRSIRDRDGEATVLNGLGAVSRSSGEFQQAMDYHHQALRLQRELGLRQHEAVTLHNLGSMSLTLGDPQQSVVFFNQALSIFRSVGDPRGEARAISNLGAAWSLAGDHQKSIEYYNQALLLHRATGDRAGEAETLSKLGVVYHQSGEQQQAMDNYHQGLSLMRAIGNRNSEAGTLINLGLVYEKSGMKTQALECFQQALSLARAIQAPEREADALLYLGRVNDGLGNMAQARHQIEESLRIVESLRRKVTAQELRSSYFASVQDSYELYIDLLMRMDQQTGGKSSILALEASERARARSLIELLAEAHADIRQGVDSSLLAQERKLRHQLNSKAEAQTRLLSGKRNDAATAAIAVEVTALTDQLQEVEAQIRVKSPRYAALTQPQPLGGPEIQKLLDDDTLLIEYALGEKNSYLWLVSPTSVVSHRLAPRAEIERVARKLYQLLTARQSQAHLSPAQQIERVKKAEAEYPALAASLSQMLLAPIAGQLGKKRLVIVASGMLEYLPFAALPEPQFADHSQPSPLLANHEMISLPSASALAMLRRDNANRARASKPVAVLADPVFAATDPRVAVAGKRRALPPFQTENNAQGESGKAGAALTRAVQGFDLSARGDLARLPFSRDEANAILAFAPDGAGLKALSFAASRATATNPDLGQYRIVHFATHGLLNSEHPELSGLVLSLVDEAGKPQDGFLRLHEIYNLRLSADLVVLSACQTALGKQVKGEGLIGLTRGFMHTGTPRVVASLWQVSDLATSELMERFYRGMLKDGQRPAAALRSAQLELMKQRRWASPYFWAAFVLQGEWH